MTLALKSFPPLSIFEPGAKAKRRKAPPWEKQRKAREREMAEQVYAALQKVGKIVVKRVRQETKAIGGVPDSKGMWKSARSAFEDELARQGWAAEDLIAEGVTLTSHLGKAFAKIDLAMTNDTVQQVAADYMDEWWGALEEGSRNMLRSKIDNYVTADLSQRELIDSVGEIFGEARAGRIAVTETTRLYAEGNRIAYAEVGIKQVEWHTVRDDIVCPVCEPLDGFVMDLGDEEEVPPAHVNCRCWLAPVEG